MVAFGAKRTCRDHRWRIDPAWMTHLCHRRPIFAVMHNVTFLPTTMWYGVILGRSGAHEATRVHHAARRCGGRVAARVTGAGGGPYLSARGPGSDRLTAATGRARIIGRAAPQWLCRGAKSH